MTAHRFSFSAAAVVLAVAAGGVASPAGAVTSPGAAATRAATTHHSVATTRHPSATTPATTPTSTLGIAGATLAPITPTTAADDDDGGGTPGGDGTWLADNGLTSPACAHSRTPSCKASGTTSIPAPPGLAIV